MVEEQQHPITLYWNVASQPSRAVKSLLLAGGVPHNTKSIDLMKGEHLGEEYKKINARGQVPYLTDGDFGLAESNAILKYLCNTQSTIPDHYWPKNDQQRALTDQFLEFYQNHARPALTAPLRLRIGKVLRKVPYTEEAMAAALTNLHALLDTLERYLGQHEGAYIVNDQPTIADLQLFFEFTDLITLKIDWEADGKYPNCAAWYNKMMTVPTVKGIQDQLVPMMGPFIAMLHA